MPMDSKLYCQLNVCNVQNVHGDTVVWQSCIRCAVFKCPGIASSIVDWMYVACEMSMEILWCDRVVLDVLYLNAQG